MRANVVEPAQVEYDAAGRPYSARYGDIYHSAGGAAGQAAHVFVGGNGLPQRWRGRDRFVVLETGFGLGVNFLATWAAWRADPQRCERLHYVAVEKHPLKREDLARALNASLGPQHADLAGRLVDAWPVLTPGLHRLDLDNGRLLLTLGFGEAQDLLSNWRLTADAIYLDGFSPACNPAMWGPALMRTLARAAAGGTTLASYTVAGSVRSALAQVGFAVERAPGFGTKRQMLRGEWVERHRRVTAQSLPAADWPERHAIVVGAGLAGCGVASGLARAGWRVTLLERGARIAGETSAHPAILRPSLARDDNLATRAIRAGYLAVLSALRALREEGRDGGWHGSGALEAVGGGRDLDPLRTALEAFRFDPAYAHWIESSGPRGAAGIWYPQAGWIDVPRFCVALLASAGVVPRLACAARRLVRSASDSGWRVLDDGGNEIARAPVVVLANALAAPGLLAASGLADHAPALHPVRGQLTLLPRSDAVDWPAHVVCGNGYVVPVDADRVAVGATYEPFGPDLLPAASSHDENLRRLACLVPAAADYARSVPAEALGAFVAQRCVAVDRMPLIGNWLDAQSLAAAKAGPGSLTLGRLPRSAGLYFALGYASRGLVWSVLGGQIIAAQLERTPAVVEADLEAALDPARFYLRARRRGEVSSPASADAAPSAPDAGGSG